MGAVFVAVIGLVAGVEAAQGSGVQLFNAAVLGQPTSNAVALLVTKHAGDAEPYVVWADMNCGEYIGASVFYRKPVTFDLVRSAVNKEYGSFEMPLSKKPAIALWRVTDPAKVRNAVARTDGSSEPKAKAVLAIQLRNADEESVSLIYLLVREPSCSTEATK